LKSREYYIVEIAKYCDLYLHQGDCADGIALDNIDRIINEYKKDYGYEVKK